jgi:hypothetical protein
LILTFNLHISLEHIKVELKVRKPGGNNEENSVKQIFILVSNGISWPAFFVGRSLKFFLEKTEIKSSTQEEHFTSLPF